MTSNDFNDTVMIMDTPGNGTSFIITNLIPDTTYTVFMSAFTGAGEGINTSSITNETLPDRKALPTLIIYSYTFLMRVCL